jgi:predicted HicB family RNase H-like nuclease
VIVEKKKPADKMKMFIVRMTPGEHSRATKAAKRDKVSFSEFIRLAAQERIEHFAELGFHAGKK